MSTESLPTVIWEDSPIAIWNDLQPTKFYYLFSDCYPGFIMMILFTIIHYLMDVLLYSRASSYANKQVNNLKEPKWIKNCKHKDELNYKTLSQISPKKFANKVIKKYELNSNEEQQELISYQKQCNQYAKFVSKYMEASFKVLVFGFVYFYGLAIIFVDAPWFWDQKYMYSQGLPQSPGDNKIFNLDLYYFFQIGYHGHRAIYQFFEYKRRDTIAMFVHHWVTVFLLVGSKMVGCQQIGATVLLCNDNCDLIMPVGKLFEYNGYMMMCTICTYLFCILWIPLRIGVYFYKVIWSITVDGYLIVLRPYFFHWICVGGLLIIYALQFYWTKYLLEMVSKKLKTKGNARMHDTRSDDENDDKIS